MEEQVKMSDVIDEIKGASEEDLKEIITKWFESTRMDGMRLGAYMISAAVSGVISKNLKKGSNSSLRDYQRAIKGVLGIISVQLKQDETQQNDSEENATEEITNDE
jgi:hypothetical protein